MTNTAVLSTLSVDLADKASQLSVKENGRLISVSCRLDSDGEPVSKDVRHIRGWVFNIRGGLVMTGFNHAPKVLTNKLGESVVDVDGKTHSLEGASFRPRRDGFLIRVMKIDGEIVYATNRSTRPQDSHCGNSRGVSFLDFFFEGLRMTREEFESRLFPSEKRYSRYAYFFTVNTLYIRAASRERDHGTVFDGSFLQFGEDAPHSELRESVSEEDMDMTDRAPEAGFSQEHLTLEEARNRLLCGETYEESEWLDEPILVDLPTGQTLRVFPPGYIKRFQINSNSMNTRKRLCDLMVLSYSNQERNGVLINPNYDNFLALPRPDNWSRHITRSDMNLGSEKLVPPLSTNHSFGPEPRNQESRFLYLAMLYAFSQPLNRQQSILQDALEMLNQRQELINALKKNFNKVSSLRPRKIEKADGSVVEDVNDVRAINTLNRIVDGALRNGGSRDLVARKITTSVLWENYGLYALLWKFDFSQIR